MNKNVFSQLAAEFEKMEKTIEFQRRSSRLLPLTNRPVLVVSTSLRLNCLS